MKSMADLITAHPFFAGVDEATIDLLAGCARNVHFRAGEVIFREGGAADAFYLVRSGGVSIQLHDPAGGGIAIDTVDADEVVGWSWLSETPRWHFDAVAVRETSAIAFDATCLRAKCEADHSVGYVFLTQVVRVMTHRLRSAQARLLDLYGHKPGRSFFDGATP